MKIDFYHWSYMCPLNYEMIQLLNKYRSQMEIHFHGITDDRQLAKKMRMFYPTLTVINDTVRHYSPLTKEFLDSLCAGVIPQELPYRPEPGEEEYAGAVIPITPENYGTAGACTGRSCPESCRRKTALPLYRNMPVLGFMNVENNELLGGAEYLPSVDVPYNIPHDGTTALITCVYLSDTRYDYKSPCLRALEKYLLGNYRQVLAISDEAGVFPNGDLNFFLRNGYEDMGIIAEEENYCTLHLVRKALQAGTEFPNVI